MPNTPKGIQFNLTAWTVALHVPCERCGAAPGVRCQSLTDPSRIIAWPHRGRGGW